MSEAAPCLGGLRLRRPRPRDLLRRGVAAVDLSEPLAERLALLGGGLGGVDISGPIDATLRRVRMLDLYRARVFVIELPLRVEVLGRDGPTHAAPTASGAT